MYTAKATSTQSERCTLTTDCSLVYQTPATTSEYQKKKTSLPSTSNAHYSELASNSVSVPRQLLRSGRMASRGGHSGALHRFFAGGRKHQLSLKCTWDSAPAWISRLSSLLRPDWWCPCPVLTALWPASKLKSLELERGLEQSKIIMRITISEHIEETFP